MASPELTFSGSQWGGCAAGMACWRDTRKIYPGREAMGQLDFSELEFRFFGPDAALILGGGT